jgi:hypothetical protein
VQQASKVWPRSPRCFQVPDKGGNGLIDPLGLCSVFLHISMGIPVIVRAGVDQFDHPHAVLD